MGTEIIRDILSTVADSYDAARPGAGDCVRKEMDERYPAIPGESRLRHVLLEVLHEGDLEDECRWAIDHPFAEVAQDARARFCNVVERKLRELLATS